MEKYAIEIKKILKDKYVDIDLVLTEPPSLDLGDLSLPCFPLAKVLKKSPMDIANDLKVNFDNVSFIDKTVVKGGYLNFFLDRQLVVKETIREIKDKKSTFGSKMTGQGKTALIEHTSINPNASPHVGRARNALIGDVLVRLLKFEGYKVDTHYFVNDVGKQIAMLVYATKDKKDVAFKELLDLYVDVNNQVKEHPQIEQDVFKLLYEFENGNEEVRQAFRRIVDVCIKGQVGLFNDLGIHYDTFQYESDYVFENIVDDILNQLKDTSKLEEDENGRLVLNQEEYNLPLKAPYLVLSRKDKTSLYPLRDIAYSIDKAKTKSDENIIILGEDQKVYHKQVSAALDVLGYEAPTPVHYSFILLTDGKMATREGRVVLLEDFMANATQKALEYMKNQPSNVQMSRAKAIAYGAVKYAILKTANTKNVIFNLDSALSFEGNTGPYLQYSIARINSILNKCQDVKVQETDYSLLTSDVEYDLVKEMLGFSEVVTKSLIEKSPHLLANYVYKLTKKFSAFYHKYSIINAENDEIKYARLILIKSIKQVIMNGLYLLGIESVEAM